MKGKSENKFCVNLRWRHIFTFTYLSFDGKSASSIVPSWNHSIFSSPVPVIEQLNIAAPPEFTIWTCGCMWTDKKTLTCKRISTRCSPNWFVALHTYIYMGKYQIIRKHTHIDEIVKWIEYSISKPNMSRRTIQTKLKLIN